MPPKRRIQRNPTPEANQGSAAASQNAQNSPIVVEPPPQPDRKIAELFLRQNPPTFTGAGNPAEAEEWVRAVERVFKFLECSDQECILCVSFLLKGPADFWWEARQKTLSPAQLAALTWNQFKEELYAKFIPRSYRKQKEIEFMSLKQGSKSVAEYDREFCMLSRYAPYKVETDEKMAEMFRSGLRPELRVILAAQSAMSYAETLNRALEMEMEMQTDKTVLGINPNVSQDQSSSKATQPGQKSGSKRKWQGRGFPNRRQFQRQGPAPQGSSRPQPQNQSRSVTCFICGQPGHLSFNCPNRGGPAGRGGGRSAPAKPSQTVKTLIGYPQRQQQFQPSSSSTIQFHEASPSQAPAQFPQPQVHYQQAYVLPSAQPEKDSGNLTGTRGVEKEVKREEGEFID